MKTAKQILAALLCALLAAALAGCAVKRGGADPAPTQGGVSGAGSGEASVGTEAAGSIGAPVNAEASSGSIGAPVNTEGDSGSRKGIPEQIRLYEALEIVSPGTMGMEEVPFYVGLFDRSGAPCAAGDVVVSVRLVNSQNVEVYNGWVSLEASDFESRWIGEESRSVFLSRVSVPAGEISVGNTLDGTIEATAVNETGQTLPKAILPTKLLPANRPDRITVVDMRSERQPLPSQAIDVYVTFYYSGQEDIALFSCYYQQYKADGTQIFGRDLWDIYNNVKAGSTFTMHFRVDPSYDPASFALKKYMFAKEDPENPSNTNVYWDDEFDDAHVVGID